MIQARELLKATGNQTGTAISDLKSGGAFQATITGTGTVGTTVQIQCSLDAANWINLGSIVLSGTTTATDGFNSIGQWAWYRAVTTGSSGTITSIRVNMSEET
jgi:hypothetical protein